MHYDLSLAVRLAVGQEYEGTYNIQYENDGFTPPGDGKLYLKYDYIEADTLYLSLDRRCVSYIGLVQISVIFPPGSGIDRARLAAKNIARFFYDGKMLQTGYVSQGAEVRKPHKSETGWMIPVCFYVRLDERTENNLIRS